MRSACIEDIGVDGVELQRDNRIRPLSAGQRDGGPIPAAVTREIGALFGAGRDHVTIDFPRSQSPHLLLREIRNWRPGNALIDTPIYAGELSCFARDSRPVNVLY